MPIRCTLHCMNMRSNGDINGIQASILRQLFRKDGLRFAEINVEGVSSDQFSYHLRQLLKYGLIEKSPDQTYSLSTMGKTRTIMLYPNQDGFIEQGFLAVRLVLTKMENGKQHFLMQQRDIVPYKGTYATPGDKVLFGEDTIETAQRVLQRDTGLTCDLRLCGIKHIKEEYLEKIVQDKYFFVFTGNAPQGELIPRSRTGKNIWMTYDEIETSGLSIQGGLELLKMITNDRLDFTEQTLGVDKY